MTSPTQPQRDDVDRRVAVEAKVAQLPNKGAHPRQFQSTEKLQKCRLASYASWSTRVNKLISVGKRLKVHFKQFQPESFAISECQRSVSNLRPPRRRSAPLERGFLFSSLKAEEATASAKRLLSTPDWLRLVFSSKQLIAARS